MKNILVVNVNWLGDVIFSSPVFKALKESYPQARISCLAAPRVQEILESFPEIDDIIVYDEDRTHRAPWAKWRLICDLRRRKFDIAFLLHRSLTRALLVFFAGIRERVGVDTKGRGAFLTQKVSELSGIVHRSDHYLRVIESFGIKVNSRATFVSVSAQHDEEIQNILKNVGVAREDFLVIIHPGGNWDLKQWSVQNFALLMDRLNTKFKIKIIISGSQKDMILAQNISSRLKTAVIVLAGQTNLKQLMAMMKRARVVISADSGPLHLASSVGTATIGLFGPTRCEVTGPRGSGRVINLQKEVGCNRAPCYHLRCPDNICMQAVSVEDVIDAFERISTHT